MAATLSPPRLLPSGDSAITVEFSRNIDDTANRRVLALDRAMAAEPVTGISETVPTYRSLLVHYDPVLIDFEKLGQNILALAQRPVPATATTRRWRIPVVYGGEHGIDLEDVAKTLDTTPDEIVARHVAGDTLQSDHTRFSNETYVVPKKPPEFPKELPLECDPPRHTALRRPLTAAFLPRQVMQLEQAIRDLSIDLVEKVYAQGTCEFTKDIAQVLPIFIFLDLVDLPRSDAPILLPIAERVVHGATRRIAPAAIATCRPISPAMSASAARRRATICSAPWPMSWMATRASARRTRSTTPAWS